MNASKTTKSLFLLVSTLALAAPLPAFAGKGGKPGGGGGGVPPTVELVPAPVEYQVTWINAELSLPYTRLLDINAAGVAVGYFYPGIDRGAPQSSYANARGFMADSEGKQWNLNDYFAAALQRDYPGWRLGFAMEINQAGQIACLLVPDDWNEGQAPAFIIVLGTLGNLYAETPTPSLITVEEFPNRFDGWSGWGIADLNEEGDVLLDIDKVSLYLCEYPFTEPPVVMPVPNAPELTIQKADLSNTGQVVFSADSTTTTTSTQGKRTVTSRTTDRNIYSWNIDGSLELLGHYTYDGSSSQGGLGPRVGASDSGVIYGNVDGIAQAWSPVTGSWSPIAPTGLVRTVSKAPTGEEVVIWSGSGTDHFIHRSGYGTFPIEVTSGLNGAADVDLWSEQLDNAGVPPLDGISRPLSSGSGYLCGSAAFELPDRSRFVYPYILTPVPVAQP